MPRYEYGCKCGQRITGTFAMRDVLAVVGCSGCGSEARRLFTVPQLKTSTLCLEANTRGLAELDSTRRTDEQAYTRNWNRRIPRL